MKPIKNLIWMRERGRGEKEDGEEGDTICHYLSFFHTHTLRQKQIQPLGGCPQRDFADTQIPTRLPVVQ